MIPDSTLKQAPRADWLYRVRALGEKTVDYEQGGIALQDSSHGLAAASWVAQYTDDSVFLGIDGKEPQRVFDRAGIDMLGLAFDQSMRPLICFSENGDIWLWWFDPSINKQSIGLITQGQNPCITLDVHRREDAERSDVILAYQRGKALYARQQRDRFTVEYLLSAQSPESLDAIGMANTARLQFRFRPANTAPKQADHAISLCYSDDGGHNWSNQRTQSIGEMGQYAARVRFHRLGSFRQRVWKITTSAPTPVNLFGAVAHLEKTE